MSWRALLAAVVLTGAACRGPAPAPAPRPIPVPQPSAGGTPGSAEVGRSAALRDEVVQVAVAVFGDSTAVTDGAVADEEPVWDLEVRSYEAHERVTHYVQLFTGTARERFMQRLSRGTRYEPMIRAKLRASGMPEDLTYLALIESGYDPHAYSRAAAVGMWQFMSSTARDVGLRVDWWVDERRDPARATDGAIKFLGYLQRQFGSFYLAAAAYNGGPGRVSRGLTRFAEELEGAEGEDRFFALAEQDYLREETRNYVPQLIAAALVAKVPGRYGLAVDTQPLYAYDSLQVDAGTSLSAVATAAGASAADVGDLNPALLRGITPPDAAVWVRLPVGTAEAAGEALAAMPPELRRGYRAVSVKEGLTPAAFAKAEGVSLKQLQWFNPTMRTAKTGRLVAGQSLRVPGDGALAYARDLPNPSIEKYGTAPVLTARGVHVVKRGETLGGIARRYGLTEASLRSLNGMRGTKVLAGQTLVVRSGTRPAAATSAAAAPAKAVTAKTTPARSTPQAGAPKTAVTAKAGTAKTTGTAKAGAAGTAGAAKSGTAKAGAAKTAGTAKSPAPKATGKGAKT
jgi:membrane-bound lytic murein transglycosylase D